mmetsp:Transcript_30475/g.65484  ORF Transcript_30475/g.65484 Transcript_30475/m.65484 type:complete len:229 (+) Transcript_30475:442-1128(+)
MTSPTERSVPNAARHSAELVSSSPPGLSTASNTPASKWVSPSEAAVRPVPTETAIRFALLISLSSELINSRPPPRKERGGSSSPPGKGASADSAAISLSGRSDASLLSPGASVSLPAEATAVTKSLSCDVTPLNVARTSRASPSASSDATASAFADAHEPGYSYARSTLGTKEDVRTSKCVKREPMIAGWCTRLSDGGSSSRFSCATYFISRGPPSSSLQSARSGMIR